MSQPKSSKYSQYPLITNESVRHSPRPRRSSSASSSYGPGCGAYRPLTPGPAVKLPGAFNANLLSRQVDVPTDLSGKQAYLHLKTSHGITGCIVNGRYVRRHHHALGDTTFLNITPWLIPGTPNRLQILAGGNAEIKEMALWVY